MCPANPGIGARNNNSLAAKSECPHVRRVRVSDPRLDRRGRTRDARLQRRLVDRTALRKIIVNNRVACHMRHVGAGSQHFSELAISFHQNCVNDIERLMLDVAVAQQLQDRLLRVLRFLQQCLINEMALFGFGS
jgi:cobalamin biosynthesis protein CobT